MGNTTLTYTLFLILLSLSLTSAAAEGVGKVHVETGTSSLVSLDANGKLVYATDKAGNRLPDFSCVGYHSGEKPLPDVPVRIVLRPQEGDRTEDIQRALDTVGLGEPDEEGRRGAVLLKRGEYHVAGTLTIRHSGVVLRGEGGGAAGTVLVATGHGERKHKRTLIAVGNGHPRKLLEETRRAITDDLVPVGAHTFAIESTAGYRAGDPIVVFRPSTAEWIHAIGCDRLRAKWTAIHDTEWVKEGPRAGFHYRRGGSASRAHIRMKEGETWEAFEERVPLSEDGKKLDTTAQWRPGSYDLYFERRITRIDGKHITIDAPIVHAMTAEFGGGAILRYETPGRLSEIGIEDLHLVSEFADPIPNHPYGDPAKSTSSELHAWHGIRLMRNTENTWVRGVTGNYFGWSLVSAHGVRATVQDCTNYGHASRISGGRRYPFMIDGQLNLMQRCLAFEGRHEFVSQARTAGPNVFVDCLGRKSKSSSGPHHRYSVGTLFDNVKSDKYMESRFRGSSGTGHGWAGAQTCFYNCIAPGFKVQAPPGAVSWVIGSGPDLAVRVEPDSLYYQQVKERLGMEALNRLASPAQRKALGQYEWAKTR